MRKKTIEKQIREMGMNGGDVCRHTFATYHAAHFRNLPELQLEMGHRDLNLLRSRYMAPMLRQAASLFWR